MSREAILAAQAAGITSDSVMALLKNNRAEFTKSSYAQHLLGANPIIVSVLAENILRNKGNYFGDNGIMSTDTKKDFRRKHGGQMNSNNYVVVAYQGVPDPNLGNTPEGAPVKLVKVKQSSHSHHEVSTRIALETTLDRIADMGNDSVDEDNDIKAQISAMKASQEMTAAMMVIRAVRDFGLTISAQRIALQESGATVALFLNQADMLTFPFNKRPQDAQTMIDRVRESMTTVDDTTPMGLALAPGCKLTWAHNTFNSGDSIGSVELNIRNQQGYTGMTGLFNLKIWTIMNYRQVDDEAHALASELTSSATFGSYFRMGGGATYDSRLSRNSIEIPDIDVGSYRTFHIKDVLPYTHRFDHRTGELSDDHDALLNPAKNLAHRHTLHCEPEDVDLFLYPDSDGNLHKAKCIGDMSRKALPDEYEMDATRNIIEKKNLDRNAVDEAVAYCRQLNQIPDTETTRKYLILLSRRQAAAVDAVTKIPTPMAITPGGQMDGEITYRNNAYSINTAGGTTTQVGTSFLPYGYGSFLGLYTLKRNEAALANYATGTAEAVKKHYETLKTTLEALMDVFKGHEFNAVEALPSYFKTDDERLNRMQALFLNCFYNSFPVYSTVIPDGAGGAVGVPETSGAGPSDIANIGVRGGRALGNNITAYLGDPLDGEVTRYIAKHGPSREVLDVLLTNDRLAGLETKYRALSATNQTMDRAIQRIVVAKAADRTNVANVATRLYYFIEYLLSNNTEAPKSARTDATGFSGYLSGFDDPNQFLERVTIGAAQGQQEERYVDTGDRRLVRISVSPLFWKALASETDEDKLRAFPLRPMNPRNWSRALGDSTNNNIPTVRVQLQNAGLELESGNTINQLTTTRNFPTVEARAAVYGGHRPGKRTSPSGEAARPVKKRGMGGFAQASAHLTGNGHPPIRSAYIGNGNNGMIPEEDSVVLPLQLFRARTMNGEPERENLAERFADSADDDTLGRAIRRCVMFTPLNRRALDAIGEYAGYPFTVVLFRPRDEFMTGAGILYAFGQVGTMLTGETTARNVVVGVDTLQVHFDSQLTAIVTDGKAAVTIPHLQSTAQINAFHNYICKTKEDVENLIKKGPNHLHGTMIAALAPYGSKMPTNVPITGVWDEATIRLLGDVPAHERVCNWGGAAYLNETLNLKSLCDVTGCNVRCSQGRQRFYDRFGHIKNIMDQGPWQEYVCPRNLPLLGGTSSPQPEVVDPNTIVAVA